MKGILRVALAAAVVFGLVQSRFASASPLDGKSFVGEMGEKGKTKGDKDTFTFKDGRFRSTACDRYGFGDAPYAVKEEGGKMVVTAETTSKKEGDDDVDAHGGRRHAHRRRRSGRRAARLRRNTG